MRFYILFCRFAHEIKFQCMRLAITPSYSITLVLTEFLINGFYHMYKAKRKQHKLVQTCLKES